MAEGRNKVEFVEGMDNPDQNKKSIVAGISKEHEICCLWHKIVRAVVSVGNFNSRLKHLIYLQNMT